MSNDAKPPYPPLRRVVTGTSPEGKSVFVEDSAMESFAWADGPSYFSGVFRTDEHPASNAVEFKDSIQGERKELFSTTGSTFWMVEMPPGKDTVRLLLSMLRSDEIVDSLQVMHRTETIDYGIVVKGAVNLILDDGKREVLKAGDVIIQRGTMHKWINEGDEWTRIFFVMLREWSVLCILAT